MLDRRIITWGGRLAFVSSVGLCSSIPSAWACGGGGVTSASGVVMGSQRIFMSVRSSGTTDMIVQITLPRTTDDYGVLIPVPSEPTLDSRAVSSTELNALDSDTAPRIDIDWGGSSSGGGCGCFSASVGDAAPKGGVIVSDYVNIGPVVAVSLTGDNADAVGAWLTEHGFQLPSSDAETLARYVGAGSYFIAIRRADTAAQGGPSSVGVHYTLQGDHRKLSLGFTKIGSSPRAAFTVFVAAPQAVGPSAPFSALTLLDLDSQLLEKNDYKGAVEAAVSSHASKAFVLEGKTTKSSVASYAPGIAQFIDDGAIVTRATTVVEREQLADDVMFATPFTGDIPNSRVASLSTRATRTASVGSLGLVLVAHALRRRGRRRGR